ncbi:MAG TPA: tetratricopeptide repeat protein [Rhizomicrobium sp.]|nr:tetratricopeptide repeat protein [Rhizomicrobium sp.]
MMRVLSTVCLWLALLCGVASADGYSNFNAGVASAGRDESDAAIKSLTQALASPDLPQHLQAVAYLSRGREFAEVHRLDAAIADYTDALKLKPDYLDAYISRCRAYAENRRYADAISDCSSAIRVQPANWRLHELRIDLYQQARRYDDAIADYSAFIATRPDDTSLLLGRANMLRLAGQYDKAMADAEAAHDAQFHSAWPYVAMGSIAFSQDKFDDAIGNINSALDVESHDSDLYVLKGQMLWANGRLDRASETFGDIFAHDGMDPYAFLWLSLSDAAQGKPVSADIVSKVEATDRTRWPGPLVDLYLGKTTPEEVLQGAAKEADGLNHEQCEADLYVGAWQQSHGHPDDATRLLTAAAGACDDMQKQLATIALARMRKAGSQ